MRTFLSDLIHNTTVASALRKVVLVVGTVWITKYFTDITTQGAFLGLLGTLLQAWSSHDDAFIRAQAGANP